jgi:ribosomal protein L11 methyltransferase
MAYIEITIKTKNAEEADVIIAHLNELNFDGFLIENEIELKAYANEGTFDFNEFVELADELLLTYTKSIVIEENWNKNWESDFEPIVVSSKDNPAATFAFVRAKFHQANSEAKFDLIITPKMSFGTGHHATTFQMIQEMSTIDFKGKHVVDFGTGTGVLAILAEKMGATSVEAMDNDEWSINNTIENIEENYCNKITVAKQEGCFPRNKADVLLANINLNVIIENMIPIKESCHAGSKIIFSGILVDDELKITDTLLKNGFIIDAIKSKNQWLLLSTSFKI